MEYMIFLVVLGLALGAGLEHRRRNDKRKSG